jgi:hypothetical protein
MDDLRAVEEFDAAWYRAFRRGVRAVHRSTMSWRRVPLSLLRQLDSGVPGGDSPSGVA